MSFSSAWPLPENGSQTAHPTNAPAAQPDFRNLTLADPPRSGHLIAPSVEETTPPNLILTPGTHTINANSSFNPPSPPFQHRGRSAPSGFLPGEQQAFFTNPLASPGPHVISNGIGAHSSSDLLRPQPNRLLKHQKSENALRHQTLPFAANSSNRAVIANASFQPSRTAPAPPPPIPPLATLVKPAPNMPATTPQPTPKKRKNWLTGGRSGNKSKNNEAIPTAWIVGTSGKPPYDTTPLAIGSRVPELWQENGNVVVYLFPKSMNRGPSFRLSSEHIASSQHLTSLAHGNVYSWGSARQSQSSLSHGGPVSFDPKTRHIQANTPGNSIGNSPNASYTDGSDDSRESRGLVDVDGTQLVHLHLPVELSNPNAQPLSPDDIQKLLLVRNLFAFLVGQALIATPTCPSTFNVFCEISKLLLQLGFSNMDCSTFGEVANQSFTSYVEELELLDMRQSREKTLQCLILGERMRSAVLWNEAFVHGVGRYRDIQAADIPIFKELSAVAIQRIERAHMDLEKRILRINHQIENFDFPSVFSGLTNSRTAPEREIARFEQWKSAFQSTRKWLLTYLKHKHKSWPPKRSKYSGVGVPALNRQALQGLYNDLTVLYDLLVDRRHPSSRLMIFGKNFPPHMDRRIEALRKVLLEYDQSGTPVYPVMPFDAPRLPRLSPNDDDVAEDPKKVGKNELAVLLKASYNKDTHDSKHPFSLLWQSFEFRTTNGMTIDKVANFRLGSWLFIYCVLQALPMLTVDAPGVHFSDGVDYFLCEPPRGRLHWSKEGQQWEWFRDPVTGVVAQLARDTIDLSDEAMYRLSHCWKMGAKWEQELTLMPTRMSRSETLKTASIQGQSNMQLPTPPASEYSSEPRYSATSSQGQYGLQQSQPSQQVLQQDQYFQQHAGSPPQHPSMFNSSPQQAAFDQFSQSPSQYGHFSNMSPSDTSSPDLMGLEAPPGMSAIQDELPKPRSRNSSPYGLARRGNRESILMMGLERLPVPATSSPMSREQRNARSASMTFDEILASPPGVQDQAGKGSRSGSRGTSSTGIRI